MITCALGVEGRELSGVGNGVFSVEVALLSASLAASREGSMGADRRPGSGGGRSSALVSPSELEVGVRFVAGVDKPAEDAPFPFAVTAPAFLSKACIWRSK